MPRSPDAVSEIDATDLDPAELHHAPRQRSARTDPSMRDGDSGHGNPDENPEDEFSIDNDIGDTENDERGTAEFLEMIPDRHGADGIDPDAEPDGEDDDIPALARRGEVEGTAATVGPMNGYDKLKISEIVSRAEKLSPGEIAALLRYEAANRNRKTLATSLNRLLKARPAE